MRRLIVAWELEEDFGMFGNEFVGFSFLVRLCLSLCNCVNQYRSVCSQSISYTDCGGKQKGKWSRSGRKLKNLSLVIDLPCFLAGIFDIYRVIHGFAIILNGRRV